MLHEIFRSFNKVWNAMYYDELIDTDCYQISYLKDAYRPYFNAAHALTTTSASSLDEIESYFKHRNIHAGIYLDPESPCALVNTLLHKKYIIAPNEHENWYAFECAKSFLEDINAKINEFQSNNRHLECILFSPITQSTLLDQFIDVNGQVNDIPKHMLHNLKMNLIKSKEPKVRFISVLTREHGEPTSTGLIGIYNNIAFLAEGATHIKFRRRGIYNWLNRICMLYAVKEDCKRIVVNCDKDAYSNNSFKRLGFTQICQRTFYKQTI